MSSLGAVQQENPGPWCSWNCHALWVYLFHLWKDTFHLLGMLSAAPFSQLFHAFLNSITDTDHQLDKEEMVFSSNTMVKQFCFWDLKSSSSLKEIYLILIVVKLSLLKCLVELKVEGNKNILPTLSSTIHSWFHCKFMD